MSALPLRALRAEPAALMRAARLADVPALETLMAPFVATGDLLPRSRYDLCRHIKEYVVAQEETERDQTIVACGSLKLYSETLAEIAGVAVPAHKPRPTPRPPVLPNPPAPPPPPSLLH